VRRSALALVLVTIAACSESPEPAATTVLPPTTLITQPEEDPLLRLALPVDPDLIAGRLDNGLTYYLRHNDSPGGRAELRLVVDAGSVQEDEDQAGMAHFLEHMMFNGTERFPRNELVDALESFGRRFGPDINAFTSFDETVYEISVTTDDEDLVQLGIDVLREWATRATLTESDVVGERGVILDEWRLRAQGFRARVEDQIQLLILSDTAYEGHLPIGTADSIRATSPAQLERFYSDWYRPDRMAVIGVGDFDVDEMEERIVDAFGDMAPMTDPREWTAPGYSPPFDPSAASFVDPEAADAGVTVIWPVPVEPVVTVGDYQRSLAVSLALEVLAERLRDDALLESGPLLGAGPIDFDWTRTIGARGVDAQVRAERVDEGMEKVLVEVERIRREGLTETEFDRAMSRFAAFTRLQHDQRESTQDVTITGNIIDHHLAGGPMMSPDQRFKVESDILDRLTKADLESALVELLGGAPAVLVVAPDDEGLPVPSADRILEVLAGLPTADLGTRGDEGIGTSELMAAPERAPIVASSVDRSHGYTTLEFENGATVYLWESDIAAGSVLAMIEGFGGTSLIEVEDLPEAFAVTEIVGRSGVGDLSVPALQRFLAGRVVRVEPWMSETRQGITGESSSRDVEIMMQLIHLITSAPRFDETAVDAVLDEMRTLNASREDLPDLLFEEAVIEGYYGDDPRYFAFPTSHQVESFDVSRAQQVYQDRFGDAADLVFAFVGDFEIAEMTDLVARYIGSLPGDGEPSGFVDNQPLPPREVQLFTIEAGTDEQGQLGMFFTNESESTLEDRITAQLLSSIVTTRLRNRIREELGATYSIFASIDLQRDPDPFAEAFIQSTGDPADLELISAEIIADLADLQASGPTDDQLDTAVAQLGDQFELTDNWEIAERLIRAHLYPDQPFSDVTDRDAALAEMTPEDIRRMAMIAFNLDQRIEVRQIPRG